MKQVFHFAQNQLGVYIPKVKKRIFSESYIAIVYPSVKIHA